MKLWPLFSRKANEDGSITRSVDLYSALFGARGTKSGASVSHSTAVEVTAVLAAARVISEGIAQVPFKLFRQSGRNVLPATDHPLYVLLHRRPNAWMTSFQMRETLALHTILTGDGIAFLNRGFLGEITEIIPITRGKVTFEQKEDYSIEYTITAPSGKQQKFPQSAIWHWRGPSWDSVRGLDAVVNAREAIGLAMMTEASQARLHSNGLRAAGTYSVEGALSTKQYEELRAFLSQEYGGAENASKVVILDRGAKFLQTSLSGVDAQHLETRRYQVEEICRAFRVMPIMVGYSDKAATYASAEQMFLAHVVHTLAPWYERIEQSADTQLLSEKDMRDGLYVKFVAAGLLRGALKDTAEYLVKLTTNGIMTRNEAREKIELNPLDGLDEPLTPSNLAGAQDKPDGDPDADPEVEDVKPSDNEPAKPQE